MSSIPGLGTKIPNAVEQLSLRTASAEPTCSGARAAQLLSPHAATRRPRAAVKVPRAPTKTQPSQGEIKGHLNPTLSPLAFPGRPLEGHQSWIQALLLLVCISPWVKPCQGDRGARSESGRPSRAWALEEKPVQKYCHPRLSQVGAWVASQAAVGAGAGS